MLVESAELEHLYFPPIEPYRADWLGVTAGHKIYWEECGNPEGRPILYLHGGPGVGCDADDRRYFDPTQWRIILLDQRGCGRSIPRCQLQGNDTDLSSNTTAHLISDILQLLTTLGVEQTVLFGGSWGSTLALAYAIAHPATVNGLVLRGIYLGTKEENASYTSGAIAQYCPEVWDRFIALVPSIYRSDPIGYYLHVMRHGHRAAREEFAYEWARYEDSLLRLAIPDDAEADRLTRSYDFQNVALIEAWYYANNSFLPDGHILDQIGILPRVPVEIVQGRYDLVCPPISAYRLSQRMQQLGFPVNLRMVTAGHTAYEPAICRELVVATGRLHHQLTISS